MKFRDAERRRVNKAAVALASKNARTAWRLITHPEEYNPLKAVARLVKNELGPRS
jgi:hypothetical protein